MNPSIGLGTIVGYASAAAAAIAPLIGELADDLTPLGVSPQVWIVVSALLAAVTTAGRMFQAGKAAGVAGYPPPDTDVNGGPPPDYVPPVEG